MGFNCGIVGLPNVGKSTLFNALVRTAAAAAANYPFCTIEPNLGRVPVPVRVPDEKRSDWESLALPLPSSRVKPVAGALWSDIAEEVLKGEGLTLAELRIRGMEKPFFSKGERAGCVRPA